MAYGCTFQETVGEQFTIKKAGQELERYRRKAVPYALANRTPIVLFVNPVAS